MTPPVKPILDFPEAFRVIKIDENNYKGAHPLLLPILAARGVYGGHTVAQTLLVAMELAPGYIPNLFHSYFVKAGNAVEPMHYRVTKLHEGRNFTQRWIEVVQREKVVFNAMVSLVKKGWNKNKADPYDAQIAAPNLHYKYHNNHNDVKPCNEELTVVEHTDYVRNAYSSEFLDYELCPEEEKLAPLERWITVWSGINRGGQPNKKGSQPKLNRQSFEDEKFNYVGLADLSDLCLLTTMARVLHLGWNPTVDNPFQEFDENRDAAKQLMPNSLNMLHLFHYNAMSLDHHIYFHLDDENGFDVSKDWLTLTYQWKRLLNNRSLLRGFMYNLDNKVVATVVQEGLTYLFKGVYDRAKI